MACSRTRLREREGIGYPPIHFSTLVPLALSLLLGGCSGVGIDRIQIGARGLSLCGLRQNPTAYVGATVRVSAWIRSDRHTEIVSTNKCGVEVFRPEDAERLRRNDKEYRKFHELTEETRFRNEGEPATFSVVEGQLELAEEGGMVLSGGGPRLALRITRVLCSIKVSSDKVSPEAAESGCLRASKRSL